LLAKFEALATFNCKEFWPDINILIAMIRPLASCMAVAGSYDSSLSGSMDAPVKFAKSLFESDLRQNIIMISTEAVFFQVEVPAKK